MTDFKVMIQELVTCGPLIGETADGQPIVPPAIFMGKSPYRKNWLIVRDAEGIKEVYGGEPWW